MNPNYWNLIKNPFDSAPATQEIFVSQSFQKNLNAILYGIQQHKELMALTGDFGVGKTTFINYLLQHLSAHQFKTLHIPNPYGLVNEFYPFLLTKLGVREFSNSYTLQSELLNKRLTQLAQSFKKLVIIVDDSHLIRDNSIFENLRLLINFQHNNRYFIHLILLGHFELTTAMTNMPQLKQRIYSENEIANLDYNETREYINHKLQAAGNRLENIFNDDAIIKIYENERGNPRGIEKICEKCLIKGYEKSLKRIDKTILDEITNHKYVSNPHISDSIESVIEEPGFTDVNREIENVTTKQPAVDFLHPPETSEQPPATITTPPVSDFEFYEILNNKVNEKYSFAFENKVIPLKNIWQLAGILYERLRKNKTILKIALDNQQKYNIISHSVNVSILVSLIGTAMLSDPKKLGLLITASLIHDIGMVKLPKDILYKKGDLTREETEQVKLHPIWGKKLVSSSAELFSSDLKGEIAEIIFQEHERSGGIGYPNQKILKDINILSQIIGLCDYFEAMTHARPWRKRMNPTTAIKNLIKLDKKYFPNQLKKTLITKLSFYPIGSRVILNTSENAEVIDINEQQPLRPVVKIIQSKYEGNNNSPDEKNLMDYPLIHISKIVD